MPRPIQHHDYQIPHLAIQTMRDRLQVVFHRSVDVQCIAARRSRDDLFHVAIRRVQQPARLRCRQHRDRVGRAQRAQIGALQRIDGDVHLRIFHALRRGRTHFFADIQHGSFVALAFSDHDLARDLYFFEGAAHGLHGRLVRSGAVALAHGAGRRNRRFFDHMNEVSGQIPFKAVYTCCVRGSSHAVILSNAGP